MKKTIIFLLILFLINCEKDEGDTYSKELIGNWDGFKTNYSYNITSSVSQTVNNPYKAGSGSIELQGTEEASLYYMYLYSTNGVMQAAISDKPFGVSMINNFVLNIYDYGDYGSFSQLTITSDDVLTLYEGILDFSVNGSEITIDSGALYFFENSNDSIMVSGALVAAQENVQSNQEFEIGIFDLEIVYLEINIKEDNTFVRTKYIIGGQTEESSGTWEATGEEITFHYQNSSDTYSYSVSDSGLELTSHNDLCMSNPDECLPQYELMYGMEVGSLENVILKETTFFNKTAD